MGKSRGLWGKRGLAGAKARNHVSEVTFEAAGTKAMTFVYLLADNSLHIKWTIKDDSIRTGFSWFIVKILLMHLLFVNRLNEQRLENNPYAVQTHVIPPQAQHSFTQSLNRKLMVA